ncbi:MAG: glycosyltransferase family 2 protein [Chloroflexota bacterium]|nr:glycosyltransferase family 2 protein [Chloroflexota bacterium]
MRQLIIMPAFNEAENLPAVLPEVRRAAPGFDILVVDDGSSDQTAAVAAAQRATVVSLPINLGYGAAVQTGFRYAVRNSYDLAVVLDADGQHDPDGIEKLAQVVAAGEADVAVGSRFSGRLEYHIPWIKKLGTELFAWVASRITGRAITDPTSGFQAMNSSVMQFFARDNYPTDYPDVDTLIILHYAGFQVIEVPVTMRERISGVSMHSGLKPIYYVGKMWLAIAVIVLRQKTRMQPKRLEE